jgi:O-methyltransferase
MGIIASLIRKVYKLNGIDVDFKPISFINNKPYSTYKPWLYDKEFLKTFEEINTLVDIFRCYELWDLTEQVIKRIPGDLLEVGVWKGGTGALISKKAQYLDANRTIFLADTFIGVVKTSDKDSVYTGGEHSDSSFQLVKELLEKNLNLSNFKILEGIFPDDTKKNVADNKFCLCHIDVDVYQSAKDIVEWIWPRLETGGVIVYDDYGFLQTDGVTKIVNELKLKNNSLIIYNLNGHAIQIKI